MLLLPVLLLSVPAGPAVPCTMAEIPETLSPVNVNRAQMQRAAASEPGCMTAYYLLGYSYLGEQNRDLDAAVKHLERARELAPDHSELLTLLGQAYLMRASSESSLSDAGDGRAALEQAIAANPANLDARSVLASFHRNAPWFAGGDMDEAYAQAAAIRELDLARGILEQARTLRADGEEDKALELAADTLRAFPDYAPLAVEYALLMQEKGKYEEAHRVLHAATRKKDADLDALYQLGRTAALSGDFIADGRDALARYIKRGEAGEDLPIEAAAAWWRLGMLEQHDGRTEQARAAYQRSLELDPENEDAATALSTLSP